MGLKVFQKLLTDGGGVEDANGGLVKDANGGQVGDADGAVGDVNGAAGDASGSASHAGCWREASTAQSGRAVGLGCKGLVNFRYT